MTPFPEYITASERDRRLDEDALRFRSEWIGRDLTEAERTAALAEIHRDRAETAAEMRRQCEDMRAIQFECDTHLLGKSEDEVQLHRLHVERVCAEVSDPRRVPALDREINHLTQRMAKCRRAA